MPKIELILGDCLEKMKDIPDKSIDLVLTDPPYGTTACKWDTIIPFEPMWEQLKRITKPKGAIVLFGSEPFSSLLRVSNLKMFKYDWVWEKTKPQGFMIAKLKPMNLHENILIFSEGKTANDPRQTKDNMPYYPQGLRPFNKIVNGIKEKNGQGHFRKSQKRYHLQKYTNYPVSVLEFASEPKPIHPTQKPIPLMEYLIKTYTNEGETVLDFTMGSGTTGVACKNLNRNFIGIELDPTYFKIAEDRINNTPLRLF